MTRKRSSTARDLLDILQSLPWWVGLLLALLSYLGLSVLAAQPVASGSRPNLVAIFAGALRFPLPLLCLLAAALSGAASLRRAQLLDKATSGDGRAAIASMHWRDFEMLLSEVYRRQGFSVTELGGNGPDGGEGRQEDLGAVQALEGLQRRRASCS